MTPLTPDQSAAHEFLSELRTRITTQPLPYQYGVEAAALKSLWEIFEQARTAIKKNPGCEKFAADVTEMLNMIVRPVTAKWHRAYEEGQLDSRDGADDFRGDLTILQGKLRLFADKLHEMAYGSGDQDKLTPGPMNDSEMKACFEAVQFGIPRGTRNLEDEIVDGINDVEAIEVTARRQARQITDKKNHNAVGLALSGGGIRSATFSLGVTQVLAQRGLLRDVDFLSTVSGGGYTGSFITVRLGNGAADTELAGPNGPDPAAIRYLRHHAKFLNPVNLKDRWSMITGTLAGMLLNWTAPLLVIVVASWVAVVFAKLGANASETIWPMIFMISGGVTGAALVAYCGLLQQRPKYIAWGGRILGWSSAITCFFGVCWLADRGYVCFEQWLMKSESPRKLTLGGMATALIAAGPAIMGFFPLLKQPALRQWMMKGLLWLAGLAIPLLALLLFYLGRHVGDMPPSIQADAWWDLSRYGGKGVLGCIAAAFGLLAIGLLNVNLTAPHRIYRDRLAKTFIQTSDDDDQPVVLHDINPGKFAPYHLINTTLNLPSSEVPELRDRKCAFFLFSKHWTGSATTGYRRTKEWKANGRSVDLATAMAVSGAAASSYMGLGSMPTLTALLTFLNVRLGFWIRRPHTGRVTESPGFLCLLREMVGFGMDEKSAWFNLSDGGHIENLGVYELLRRRCKFITCVDGEADPDFHFAGLLTLVRHAQIDYGIRIEPDVKALRPDPATGYSQTHALFCRIHYPEVKYADEVVRKAETGLLLYMKLSVTGNETELINRYRALHPDFPHESTADQFFKEEQFEAYRQLGVHVAEGLFSPALRNYTTPATVSDWFRQLASNLLLPTR